MNARQFFAELKRRHVYKTRVKWPRANVSLARLTCSELRRLHPLCDFSREVHIPGGILRGYENDVRRCADVEASSSDSAKHSNGVRVRVHTATR
jgi:hypothetical protein